MSWPIPNCPRPFLIPSALFLQLFSFFFLLSIVDNEGEKKLTKPPVQSRQIFYLKPPFLQIKLMILVMSIFQVTFFAARFNIF